MASFPSSENRLRILKPHSLSRTRLGSIGLFVKEWGGVATVLIAILYTTPTLFYDRLTAWWGQSSQVKLAKIGRVREVLSKTASLRGEWAIKQSSIPNLDSNPEAVEMLQTSYQALIYNELYINKELIDQEIGELRSSEIYMLTSSLVMIGEFASVERYYDLALAKASDEKNDKIIPVILREKAYALYTPSPYYSKDKARVAYVTAIQFSYQLNNGKPNYWTDRYLSELGVFEMQSGDRKCGQDLVERMYPRLQGEAAKGNPEARRMLTMLSRAIASLPADNGQQGDGCPFKVLDD